MQKGAPMSTPCTTGYRAACRPPTTRSAGGRHSRSSRCWSKPDTNNARSIFRYRILAHVRSKQLIPGEPSIPSTISGIHEITSDLSRINTKFFYSIEQGTSFHAQTACSTIWTTHAPFGLAQDTHSSLLFLKVTDYCCRTKGTVVSLFRQRDRKRTAARQDH